MTNLTIRPATVTDIGILYEWDDKPHVKAAVSNSGTSSFDIVWEEEIGERSDGTEFFIAEVSSEGSSRAIGALQIINPATERTHYWGSAVPNQRAIDIWIGEEEFIGQGYGTQMMAFAINHCFEPMEVTTVLIDPLANNTRSHKFYKTLGFEFLERRQFDDESDCFVFKLTREVWENKYRECR